MVTFLRPPIDLVAPSVCAVSTSGLTDNSGIIRSLRDLIRYNVIHNPNHFFGVQSKQLLPDSPFIHKSHPLETCSVY